jgi:hypothetical protein
MAAVLLMQWASSTTDIVNADVKQKYEKEGGVDEIEIHTAVRRNLNSSQNK